MTLPSNLRLPLRAFAVAIAVAGGRLLLDLAGADGISVTPLVASIITANVFVVGFLLSGVLADYKESEKLPGDLAVSLGAIADESFMLWKHRRADAGRDCLAHVLDLVRGARRWFAKSERTASLTEQVSALGDFFAGMEPCTQPNFIVRLKQEQAALSRIIVRIHTIRETSFVSSGYVMARLSTAIVILGLLLLELHPWYESAFLVGVIAWFLAYLILLISDLDNPFDYAADGSPRGQEVSLKPLADLEDRVARLLALTRGRRADAAT